MRSLKYLFLLAMIQLAVVLRVSAQTAPIDSAERESERKRWNDALVKDSTYPFNKKPNAFLAEVIKGRKPGRAVDVAMGQGRNALYLSQMGWETTGFDIADEALAAARDEAKREHVKLDIVQQGMEEFDFGAEKWDLISFLYSGCIEEVPGIAERMAKGLKHGGIIVFEFFHREAGIAMNRPDFGCPANAEKEALLHAGAFKIISYEEKMGMSDYGLDQEKMIYLLAEKK